MIFLDPKSDLVFKRLFGDIKHKNILIHFLNSVLDCADNKKIVDVVINDPNNLPKIPSKSKSSIVDIKCTDQDNNTYIVEMQIVDQQNFEKRVQFYSAQILSDQLIDGENYKNVMPVICIGILNFDLFKSEHYLSHHFILNSKTHEHALKHLSWHFIELKKFHKNIEDISSDIDKWIYFFKHAASLQMVPSSLNTPVMKEAFEVLERGHWSQRELEIYNSNLDDIRSAAGQIDAAEDRGGKKRAIAIAKQLLGVLDVETISKTTGLTAREVEDLKKQQ